MSISRRAALTLLPLGLAGCNLRPLHGSDAPQVQAELATTRIQPLANRLGQKLHNLLRDRINPYGQPLNPVYDLAVAVSRTETESGLREDETATRITLTLTAQYVLVTVQGAQEVTRGSTGAQAVYNILENRYSSLVSEEAAEERALVIIADAIADRLAAALG